MAEEVRRQVVSDPLAQQVRGQTPDRSLPMMGIGSHQTNGDAGYRDSMEGLKALTGIQAAVAKVAAAKNDENFVTGKMQYMTGVSEQEMLKHGDKYTQQGYEALSSVDQASTWYTNELAAIDETTREMDPKAYQSYLMQKRKEALSNLPNDPDIKKLYVAAFEEYGPRLADEQFKAHNGLNRTKNINSLSDAAYSSAGANEDASRVMPGGPLRVSPGVVSPQVQTSADDRDAGIRTMLGEAGGEGEIGMAAVAHVMKNRAIDGGYGGSSIYAVAHAPKQFSAWNAGPGGIPGISKYRTDSAAYIRAGKVYDAVMSGHNADMTNGATHYYSPQGMKLLVNGGSQSNLVPHWWNAESAKNSVTIGNHRFGGRARNLDGFTPHITQGQAEHERDIDLTPAGDLAVQAGIPLQHQPGSAQVRQLFDASTLRDEDKAVAATDAMVRGLDSGNDQVYNDLGGEGYLRRVGATEAQINAVQAARSRQVKNEQDKFNVDAARQEEDLHSAVKAGQFKTVDEVLQAAKGLQTHLGQDEAWGHSLANEVLTEWHKKTDDDAVLQPQLAADIAGVRQQMVENPDYTAQQAVEATMAIGDKYNQTGETVQGWIKDMFNLDASRREKLAAKLEAKKKITDKEDIVKRQVESALKSDSGLASVTGPDIRVMKNGDEVTVSPQKYGIQVLKDKEAANAATLVRTGKVKPEVAEFQVNRAVYEKLAKQGVVDTEHGQELAAALRGDVTDPKTGKVSEGAMKSFDFWLQMTKNPNVGPNYMNTMIGDKDALLLLNTATEMYDGRGDIASALRAAQLRLSQKIDPVTKLELNTDFHSKVDTGIQKVLDDKMAHGLFQHPAFNPLNDPQLQSQMPKYKDDIVRRANEYNFRNPKASMETKVKMAVEDFENDAVVVSGNILLGDHTKGQRLDQRMGLEKVGPDAPQRAVALYMKDFGETLFPHVLEATGYEDNTNHKDTVLSMMWNYQPGMLIWNNVLKDQTKLAPYNNMYNVEYDSERGLLEIQARKEPGSTDFVGTPQIIPAAAIGQHWIEKQRTASRFDKFTRSAAEALSGTSENSTLNDWFALPTIEGLKRDFNNTFRPGVTTNAQKALIK